MRRGIKIKVGSAGSGNSNQPPAPAVNPLTVQPKRGYYHPFAQNQTPIEKWQDLMQDCAESAWFCVYDSVAYLLDKLWQLVVAIVCIPIAIFGLIFDKLRFWVKKVSLEITKL